MMAGRCDCLLERFPRRGDSEKAGVAPCLGRIQTVEGMAGGDACLATRTEVEFYGKSILLIRGGRFSREEMGIEFCPGIQTVMETREPLHGRQGLLFPQQFLYERRVRHGVGLPVIRDWRRWLAACLSHGAQ